MKKAIYKQIETKMRKLCNKYSDKIIFVNIIVNDSSQTTVEANNSIVINRSYVTANNSFNK